MSIFADDTVDNEEQEDQDQDPGTDDQDDDEETELKAKARKVAARETKASKPKAAKSKAAKPKADGARGKGPSATVAPPVEVADERKPRKRRGSILQVPTLCNQETFRTSDVEHQEFERQMVEANQKALKAGKHPPYRSFSFFYRSKLGLST